jgi:hypothetical protein
LPLLASHQLFRTLPGVRIRSVGEGKNIFGIFEALIRQGRIDAAIELGAKREVRR